jgi:hypothetical protein
MKSKIPERLRSFFPSIGLIFLLLFLAATNSTAGKKGEPAHCTHTCATHR